MNAFFHEIKADNISLDKTNAGQANAIHLHVRRLKRSSPVSKARFYIALNNAIEFHQLYLASLIGFFCCKFIKIKLLISNLRLWVLSEASGHALLMLNFVIKKITLSEWEARRSRLAYGLTFPVWSIKFLRASEKATLLQMSSTDSNPDTPKRRPCHRNRIDINRKSKPTRVRWMLCKFTIDDM